MNPFLSSLPNFVTAAVLAALAIYVGGKLHSAASKAFVIWLWACFATTVIFGLSIAVQDPAAKTFLAIFRSAPTSFVPVATLWFVYQLIGNPPARLLSWVKAIIVVPVIATILALTSPWQHLLTYSITIDPITSTPSVLPGPMFIVLATTMGLVYAFALLILARSAYRAPPPFKQQQWLFFGACVPPLIVRWLFVHGISPIPGYNLTPIFVALGSAALAYALVRRGFLDIAPIARQNVVELIGDLMVVVDSRGRLVDLNLASQRTFGISLSNSAGQPVASVLPQLASFLRLDGTEREIMLTAQGTPRSFAVTTSAVRDRRGAMLGTVLLLHDVTELKQRADDAQEEARRQEELNRMKDGFVATVSHELRTPLNAIIGLTDVLLDEQLAPEVRPYVQTIHNSGEVLLTLINDVLDLAKLKSGKVEVERVPFSILTTVETALSLFAVACEKKGLELSWLVPPEVPLLEGDPARVRQILLNLVGNAVKFTREGEIQLTVDYHRGPERCLMVQIADTGQGIPPDKRETIFEEFTQVDTSTTRNVGGTGLGLPIVRQLARLMGGDVRFDENPGGGSLFTLTLPLSPASPTPRPFLGNLRPVAENPAIVVCVEHPLRRQQITSALRHLGGQVFEATSLAALGDAIAHVPAVASPPGAIIVDMRRTTPERLVESALIANGKPIAPVVLLLDSSSLLRDAAAYRALGIHELLQRPARLRNIQESLQRLHDSPLGPPSLAPKRSGRRGGPRLRMLVVDDVDENRILIGAYLKDSHVEVDYAQDGAEGLERFREKSYDLVFLDVEMPIMDGYVSVVRMREFESGLGRAATPIIALTAHHSSEHHRRSEAAGFTRHLDKPIRKTDFLELVAEFSPVATPAPADVEPHDPSEDALLADLRKQYLQGRRAAVGALRESIDRSDFHALREFGHALKGTGGSFGFPELTLLGAEIEDAAKARRIADMAGLARRYEELIAEPETVGTA